MQSKEMEEKPVQTFSNRFLNISAEGSVTLMPILSDTHSFSSG